MGTEGLIPGHPHSRRELCAPGQQLYADALRTGRIPRTEVEQAPCLIDLALVHADPDDSEWLRPLPPTVALGHLVHPIEQEIQERRRIAIGLTETFAPFLAMAAQNPVASSGITVLEGLGLINTTLDRVVAECSEELLTVQPGSGRKPGTIAEGLRRVTPLLDRRVKMRTLYQHTARHHSATIAYVDRVGADVEVRTLEEIIDRLIVVDRKVAFIPGRSDRQVALQLRHPGLVEYLVGVFDQLWRHAVPWDEQPVTYRPELDGITGIQRSIARLLVDGHVDDAIARRLGMNVRTCRSHIAKLATTLGSGSRTQLGYLIARSGLLDEAD